MMVYNDSLNERGRRPEARFVLYCLAANTLCAFFAFGLFMLREGGVLFGGHDFNEQQVVFSMFANQSVRSGWTGWSPAIDLGSSFIGAMSFYNLGSPWFWCSVLFPPAAFPKLVGFLYITKYTVAGLTSFLFISRYVKNGHAAVLGSMLYAFSGFQCVNLLFYHFHDVTALFPMMLIGMDDLLLEKKRGRFALYVFINALVNYFFFVGEVMFLVLYYIVRFFFNSSSGQPSEMERRSGLKRHMDQGQPSEMEQHSGLKRHMDQGQPSEMEQHSALKRHLGQEQPSEMEQSSALKRHLGQEQPSKMEQQLNTRQRLGKSKPSGSEKRRREKGCGQEKGIGTVWEKARWGLRGMLDCLAEGVLGGGMAAALMVPSLLAVMQNSRATGSTLSGTVLYDARRYLAIVRSVVLPGEMMSAQASLYPSGEWTSCAAYLPAVGIVLLLAFVLRRKKHWLSILLILSAVTAFIPYLNDAFSLYSDWYCRWYYMPVLFAALASAAVIDEAERYPVRASAVITGLLLIGFAAVMWFLPSLRGWEPLVADRWIFVAEVVAAALGIVVTMLLVRKIASLYLLIGVFSIATTAFTLAGYQKSSGTDAKTLAAQYEAAQEISRFENPGIVGEDVAGPEAAGPEAAGLEAAGSGFDDMNPGYLQFSMRQDIAGYRVREKSNNIVTMLSGLPSAGNFCSTVSGSILRFYEALGIERTVVSPYVEGEEYLLSEAYSVVSLDATATDSTVENPESDTDGLLKDDSAQKSGSEGRLRYQLVKTVDTNPIGFTYSHYITASELSAITGIDENDTAKLRLQAMRFVLVVPDDKERLVAEVLEKADEDVINSFTLSNNSISSDDGNMAMPDGDMHDDAGNSIISAVNSTASSGFAWSREGFSCTISPDSDTYAFFGVPNDKGWKAYVNGEEAEIIDICGLMAVRLQSGANDVRFLYETPGLKAGVIVSCLSWVLWGVSVVWSGKRWHRQ